MAKKLNSMLDYQARMPKQPHDVSQSFTFTFAPAMLLPCYYDMLHAGDELHFSNGLFARLQNPITAPLGDIDFHLDYFFVPLSVMYTPSTSMFYQTDDLISSAIIKDSLVKDKFPRLYIDQSLRQIATVGVGTNQPAAGNVVFDAANFDCIGKAAYRLCDAFDLSALSLFNATGTTDYNPKSTPWFLCAYQAAYELYYRNDDREPKSYCYNLDLHYDGSSEYPDTELFRLRYVSRYRDYFNAIKVSPIGSSVSMLSGSSSWNLLSTVNSYLASGVYNRVNSIGTTTNLTDDESTTTRGLSTLNSSFGPSFTSANIRQLFMVDKLLRVTGRANKDYESQFLAHFGIKIPHDVLHNITHIGHDMVSMSAQPVIASANTWNGETGSALGEVGGQGTVSLQGKKFNFRAPCHGVFMAIIHFQPKLRYFSGINKLHDLSDPMKFWQPEYDRKGMQPLFEYETNRDSDIAFNTNRVGWQFAFEHFKRKYDKVSTAFKNIYLEGDTPSVNFYSPWVMATRPYCHPASGYMNHGDNYDFTDFNFTDLLATPHDLDNIMTVAYSSNWITNLQYDKSHLLFQTDPVIVDYHMNCKKVNCMSEFGEPELD